LGGCAPARFLLEASTESEWVARTLEALGHEVIVADPNFSPMYATRSRRVKTDRRDARALAEVCRSGAYRPAHRASDKQRRTKNLLAVREALVRTRARYICVSKSLLRAEGLRLESREAARRGGVRRGGAERRRTPTARRLSQPENRQRAELVLHGWRAR
jgi:transposase